MSSRLKIVVLLAVVAVVLWAAHVLLSGDDRSTVGDRSVVEVTQLPAVANAFDQDVVLEKRVEVDPFDGGKSAYQVRLGTPGPSTAEYPVMMGATWMSDGSDGDSDKPSPARLDDGSFVARILREKTDSGKVATTIRQQVYRLQPDNEAVFTFRSIRPSDLPVTRRVRNAVVTIKTIALQKKSKYGASCGERWEVETEERRPWNYAMLRSSAEPTLSDSSGKIHGCDGSRSAARTPGCDWSHEGLVEDDTRYAHPRPIPEVATYKCVYEFYCDRKLKPPFMLEFHGRFRPDPGDIAWVTFDLSNLSRR